jgi:hypothetical protein
MYWRLAIYSRRFPHTIIFWLRLEAGVALSLGIGALFVCRLFCKNKIYYSESMYSVFQYQ